MKTFASVAPRSAAPQNERGPDANTKNATRDLDRQPTPRLDWSFRNIASSDNLPDLSFSSLSRPAIQRKLVVNEPGDRYEQEADRIAEQVMRMPASGMSAPGAGSAAVPVVQRKCSKCEEEEKLKRKCDKCEEEEKLQRKCDKCEEEEKLHRKSDDGLLSPATAPPIVHDVLNSPGHPLDSATRAFFEPRLGYDFSRVRVHHDYKARQSAASVNARAYTVGKNIIFGDGHYAPSGADGRKLLAHELTHVIQQDGGVPRLNPTLIAETPGVSMRMSSAAMQRDLATPLPAVPASAKPNLTPEQIQQAIAYNRARYDKANTRLIQDLLGGPVTGTWTEENIEAIAATQEQYNLTKDGKVGDQLFRFLNNEQRLEGNPTTNEKCLVSFRLIGPDPVQSGRDDPSHCHFKGHHAVEAQFSSRCNCDEYEYRQFIRGHWRRNRAGVVTDLAIREPGGILPAAFIEDTDTAAAVPHYGHRADAAEVNPEDHYFKRVGDHSDDDQAHGCKFRMDDTPGFPVAGQLSDCQPGDTYDLLTEFRGEIQRNGKAIEAKSWTDINLPHWTP